MRLAAIASVTEVIAANQGHCAAEGAWAGAAQAARGWFLEPQKGRTNRLEAFRAPKGGAAGSRWGLLK